MWGGALEDTVCRLGVFSGEEDALGDGIWIPGAFLDQERTGLHFRALKHFERLKSTLSYITLRSGLAR